MKRKKQDTQPIQPAAEWARAKDIKTQFGIPGATLYALEKLGKIKSVLLPVTSQTGGIRLFSVKSVRDAISAAKAERQDTDPTTETPNSSSTI